MAEIRPFRGVRYNMGITGGLREVIGPPEDIPSPERAAAIVQGRPFNCVRLEMPDVPGDDGFHEARRRYCQWLAEGVLIRDPVPALYLYEHEFAYDGRRLARRGFFAALRLTAPEAGDVLPHERILPQNLGLRTALLRHVRANLSAVYTLIADDGRVERVLAAVAARDPDVAGEDDDGSVHRLWRIDDAEHVDALRQAVAGRSLVIADGHHRYAAALAYRDELLAAGRDPGPADYVLTYIADVADPGILILPIHRVLRSLAGRDWAAVRAGLERYFAVAEGEALAADLAEATRQAREAVERLAAEPGDRPTFLALPPGGERLLHLRLRDWDAAEPLLPEDAPIAAHLDVAVLDAVLLRHLLGLDAEAIEREVDFTPDVATGVERARSGGAAALFVRPTPLASLLAVARSGERMPQKSTYFYPKIPTGLVIYDLSNGQVNAEP